MPRSTWARRFIGAGAALMGLGALAYIATSQGDLDQLLTVGSEAPDFEGHAADGTAMRLSDARGRWVVVYFYPKDDTPGCTRQACAFRDAFARYAERDIVVFGVSRDDRESHERFQEKHRLPFPLVADESGAVQRAYGVPSRLNMSRRVTFLVQPTGRIAHVWPEVDPGVDAREVLEAVAAHTGDGQGS
jgi:thioredoxin-dependent peroxiredoxin